ncbi:MAG TPA: hypothetical protein GX390_04135 [Acholeplasmataceae bacterium]|jgi:co-chaperonin GroES (HSP10)|nr:hypothetical protein [Acholeplasmataceae bacterium]
MIKPTDDYLLLLPDKAEGPGTLLIGTNENVGIVAEVSATEVFFKPGHKVVYRPEKAMDVYHGLQKYRLVKKEDVLAVIIDE